MKEEAPTKKLPPKMSGGCASTSNTPTKVPNDEILSSLLRIHNFDSISSIKDESLDIDLSACVTISADSAMMINGNSLSTTDFWRVLDESAQNSQLDLTMSSDEGACSRNESSVDALELSNTPNVKSPPPMVSIKQELPPSTFSGTFLRPEPPPPGAGNTFSPLKKIIKTLQVSPKKQTQRKQPQQQRKTKMLTGNASAESKRPKAMQAIKEEPKEILLMEAQDNAATSPISHNHSEIVSRHTKAAISPPKFKLFMLASAPNQNQFNTNTSSSSSTTNNNNNNNRNNNITQETAACKPSSQTTISKPKKVGETAVESLGLQLPENLYKCVDCDGMLLQGPVERSTHELAGHHVLYKCNVCERDFEQESGLKKHLKTHRAVETRKDAWKKCPDCGKCLKLGSMWMHRKIHSENKKYGCDICGQKFVQKINLTHHSRVHTAEKPYECPECQKRFQERSHLYRHQKYHAQTRSYRCDKCGKMYKTERCLKVHNLVHLEQRPFACNVCDKSFISNSKLKQHSNIHTGERPFKCNYCPRDFTNFPNWLKHTRRRHKVDHKTGEHLENIPSYCSKKSTKTAQTRKTTPLEPQPPAVTPAVATELKPNNASVSSVAATKSQIRRKKKPDQITTSNTTTTTTIISTNTNTNNSVGGGGGVGGNSSNLVLVETKLPSTPIIATTKAVKVKRERKQAMPKQVQQAMNPPPVPPQTPHFALPALVTVPSTPPISHIKREVCESAKSSVPNSSESAVDVAKSHMLNTFTDLHCLSITSAEELIMEQALEMEESGLFDGRRTTAVPAGITDTDNAVSANETAAVMHFKVKNEYENEAELMGIKQEEYLTVKDSHSRVLCSSLESSPYSSPASIELCAVAPSSVTTAGDLCTASVSVAGNSSVFFLGPNFQLHHSLPSGNATLVSSQRAGDASLLPTVTNVPDQPATQALLNQLYMPTLNGSGMLLPLQSNQMLPSVDTLLFSAAAAAAAAASRTPSAATSALGSTSAPRYYRTKGVTPQDLT